jgi:single-strand DNA-binding protein
MVNFVEVIGRVGRDPEGKYTPNGSSVHSFSVATDRRWQDKSGEWKQETDWVAVSVWNKEWVGNGVHKGDLVRVIGRLQTRSYDKNGEKRYVTEVVAKEVRNLTTAVKGKEGRAEERAAEEGQDTPW